MKMTKREMAKLIVSALHNLDHIATKKDRLAWLTIDKMEKTYSRNFLESNIDKAITVLKSRNIIVSDINKWKKNKKRGKNEKQR